MLTGFLHLHPCIFPLVSLFLQHCDQTLESNFNILTLHQRLGDLCRSDLCILEQDFNFLKQRVVSTNSQVIRGQRFEALIRAIRHVDVHVHSPRTQQCRVQFALVISSEYDDSFFSTIRPQAIGEVQQSRQRNLCLKIKIKISCYTVKLSIYTRNCLVCTL